jgi:hypothetical protein
MDPMGLDPKTIIMVQLFHHHAASSRHHGHTGLCAAIIFRYSFISIAWC